MNSTLYINGSFLASSRLSGVQRYGIEITRRLIQYYSKKNKRLIILTNKVYSNALMNEFLPFLKIYPSNKLVFEQIILPWVSRGGRLLSLSNSGPIFHFNHYFVLHDTLVYDFPNSFNKKFRIFYKFIWLLISKTAKHFFTVSEFSKNNIIKHLKINEENISIVSNGYEHLQKLKPDNKFAYSNYVLFVGSFAKHKNFDLLIDIYENNSEQYPQLIMAGGYNNKVFKKREHVPKKIILIKDFSDKTLVNLYTNCLCVVFPSKFEGFGIPIIECVYYNKPLICSDIPVFREIGQEYPNYFNLSKIEELKRFLREIKNGVVLKKGKRKDILKKYSWENSLNDLINKI